MNKSVTAFPLTWPAGWPRAKRPEWSRFKRVSSFGANRDELIRELERMGARQIILSTNIPTRLDGLPYANAREPDDSGVAVYFQLNGKPMVFACDCWMKVSENLRAILKTVEALRGIERWGASDLMNRAFTGFLALPAPTQLEPPWWDVLGIPENSTAGTILERYRELANKFHPDHGGSDADMSRINRALQSAKQQGLVS